MRDKIAEYEAVQAAAEKFVKSVAEGNSKYARELFIDEAVLFGFLDGTLEHGSIEQFLPQRGQRRRRETIQSARGRHRRGRDACRRTRPGKRAE